MFKPNKMAKSTKLKFIVKRPCKIGLKKDGIPKKEYIKGDPIYVPKDKIKIYKNNNII